jgi:DNA-binding NtrC family response regulator
MVAIVDDDDFMRSALEGLLKAVGLPAQAFASAEEFLKSGQHRRNPHLRKCPVSTSREPAGCGGNGISGGRDSGRCGARPHSQDS